MKSRRHTNNNNGVNIKSLFKGGKKINLLSEDTGLKDAMLKARYEAWKDPYRGMFPYFSVSEGNNAGGGDDFSCREMESPWWICSSAMDCESSKWYFAFEDDDEPGRNDANSKETAIEIIDDDSKDSVKSSIDKPETVALFQCGCPCVDKWARDQWEIWKKKKIKKSPLNKKKAKKQKRHHSCLEKLDNLQTLEAKQSTQVALEATTAEDNSELSPIRLICGKRPPGNDLIFPCDRNPYCLISLGGILSEYLNFIASKKCNGNVTGTGTVDEEISHDIDEFLEQLDFGDDSTKSAPDVRKSYEIEARIIREHLIRYICKRGESHEVDDCLDNIQSIHHELVMYRKDTDSTSSKLSLSAPPGLINLGATCYLNSQLQCLAQNLGFAHGIFSWKRRADGTDVNNRMDKVLETMQSILARMRYGPNSIVCTNEFSAALSLENDEMQDPNEFARLLFDRMRETLSSSCLDDGDLGDLLPSIFGGSFLYITTCSECCQQTRKSEEFMDVTLPIANDVGLPQNASVDIQRCIDLYLDPEHLVQDNQYFCLNCNKKCDAKRDLLFKKLPPVLNIQLARYVFDRETLAKRKVKTKVLLPKELKVPFIVNDSQSGKNQIASLPYSDGKADYVLCAVQNHLGTSAYQGHYTADVMDWTTGLFYEFNDGDVNLLEDGPVSSFEPNIDEDRKITRGSEDAYNLFYVEKNYLSKKSLAEIAKVTESNDSKQKIHENVLVSMKYEREEYYNREEKVQNEKLRRRKRLDRRKILISKRLLFGDTGRTGFPSETLSGESVWIDSSILRRFLSCDDSLEEIFQNANVASILNNKSYLCTHSNGLNPNVACRGKLIPLEIYQAVKEIIEEEYDTFLRYESDGNKTHSINGARNKPLQEYVFNKDSNLRCKKCGLSHQSEMREKLKCLERIVSMYDALTEEQCGNKINLDPRYAISRNFVTSFQKYVEKKVRYLTGKGKGKNEGFSKEVIDLDLDDLHSNGCIHEDDSETTGPFEDGPIDVMVNSKITCKHGKCPTLFNHRIVHEISQKTWKEVLSVFPNAIEHMISARDEYAIGNCKLCYEEKQRIVEFPDRLDKWRSRVLLEGNDYETNSPSWYHPLLDLYSKQNNFHNREDVHSVGIYSLFDGAAAVGDCRKYILLHQSDIKRWIKAVDIAADAGMSKKKIESAKQHLKDLIFVSDDSTSSGRSWKIRHLACRNHNRCNIAPTSFEARRVQDTSVEIQDCDLEKWLAKCHHANVAFFDEICFISLIESFSSLENIIYGTCSHSMDELKSRFPLVSVSATADGFKCSLQDSRGFCECKCVYSEDYERDSYQQSTEPPYMQGEKPKEIDLAAADEPEKTMCKICVHEIEDHMAVDVAASQITASNSLSTSDDPHTSAYTQRRSRRKRTEQQMFITHNLDMSPHANIAHLRLRLHEKTDKKLLGQRLFILVPSVMPSSDLPIAYEIKFESNNSTFRDFICVLCGDSEDVIAKMHESTVHLLMSYNSGNCTEDDRRRTTRKRQTPEEKELEEAVMSSLTEAASNGLGVSDEPDIAGIGSRASSKKRKVEKGFSGTFLQSSSKQSSNLSSMPSSNLSYNSIFKKEVNTLPTEARKMGRSNDNNSTASGDSIEVSREKYHISGESSDVSATATMSAASPNKEISIPPFADFTSSSVSLYDAPLLEGRESVREMMLDTFDELLPRLDEMISRLIDEDEKQSLIHTDLSDIVEHTRKRIRTELQRRGNSKNEPRLPPKQGTLIKNSNQAKIEFEELVKRLIMQEKIKLDHC